MPDKSERPEEIVPSKAGSEPKDCQSPATPEGERATLTRMRFAAELSQFTSPFPPPEVLAGYEQQVKPGLSDRVIDAITAESLHRRKLQEAEALHRRKLEDRAQAAQEEDTRAGRAAEKRGQICATIICLFIVGCGAAVAMTGYTVAGSLIGSGAAVLGIVNAFLSRKEVGRTKESSPPKPENSTSTKPSPNQT